METADQESTSREHDEAVLRETIAEGRDRLERTWIELVANGLVAGIDVSVGVVALLVVEHETGSRLLGAMAFTIGFIALILGKTELFDEDFLVPVAAAIADKGRFGALIRLWTVTAATNLVGCWIFAGLTAAALAPLADTAAKVASFYPERGISWESFALGVLGGAVITLMTWMEHGSTTEFGTIVAAVVAGFLLAATPLNHIVIMSAEMFVSLHYGAPFGYLDWLGMAVWVTFANVTGGLLLVTVLRIIQGQAGPGQPSEEAQREET
jgi:formate/nitrite transporter FocA (FNT family)